MATKKEYLSYLSFLIGSGTISKKDLESAYFKATGEDFEDSKVRERNSNIEEIEKSILLGLSIFGGLILVFIIFLFLNSYWNYYDPLIKLLITLGFGSVLFISGLAGYKLKFLTKIPNIAILFSSILIPIGLGVLTREYFNILNFAFFDQFLYFTLGVFYLLFFFFFKKTTILFVSIINLSWAYLLTLQFNLINYFNQELGSFLKIEGSMMLAFGSMGLVYLLLSVWFQKTPYKSLNNFIIPAGSLFIYLSILLSTFVLPIISLFSYLSYGVILLLGFYFSYITRNFKVLILNTVFSILQTYLLYVNANLSVGPQVLFERGSIIFWVVFGVILMTSFLVGVGMKRMGKSLL